MARQKKITVRLSDEEWQLIRAEAYRQNRDIGPHVHELLRPHIHRLRQNSAKMPEAEAA